MVDLHAHTDCSDGTLSPAELVRLAARKGLRALAITDHDTVEGCPLAEPAAVEHGVELIFGVELSAKHCGRAIHVLGYFLWGAPRAEFHKHLAEAQQARNDRNRALADRLQELGFHIELEEVEALGRSQTARPHFAEILVRKGYSRSHGAAFADFLDEGRPAFVPRRDPSAETAVGWIHESGGIASWAHPWRDLERLGQSAEQAFGKARDFGLDAVECYHPSTDPEQSAQLRRATESLGLAISGGSDFHQPCEDRATLGDLQIPDEILENLKAVDRQAVT